MEPIVKFNSGAGAVLCSNCRVIVHSHFNKIQWEAILKLNTPCYCENCNEEKNKLFQERYTKKIDELLKEMPDVF